MTAIAAGVAPADAEATPSFLAPQRFLVGSWTSGVPEGSRADQAPLPSRGLYLVDMSRDGTMQSHLLAALADPSWIAPSPDGRVFYASGEDNGDREGRITALRWENNVATVLNQVPSGGEQPTHAQVSPDGRVLLVANYSSRPGRAGVAVFALGEDGRIGRMRQFVSFLRGDNAVPARQTDGHAHSVVFAPDGKTVYAADLGGDVIRAFRFRPDNVSPLQPWGDADIHFPSGSGPRHLVFAPDGRHAYATTEMSAELHVFANENDRLQPLQVLPLTDKTTTDAKGGAGMAITPDGRFLFAGNRRDANEINSFRLGADGRATLVGRFPSGGREPRAIAVDMIGARLLVANTFTNAITEFAIDRNTGALAPSGVAPLPMALPTDIKFVR